jgi:hypothetical protein
MIAPEIAGDCPLSDPAIRPNPNGALGDWADAALAFFRERLFANGDLEPAIVVLRRHGREVGGFAHRRFRDGKRRMNEIVIDPDFLGTAKPPAIGKVFAHQLVHAALAFQGRDGSRGRHTLAFVELARTVGLDVKVQDEKVLRESIVPGSRLQSAIAEFTEMSPIVGAFTRRKPRPKRFLLCSNCGWKIPVAQGARLSCEGRKPDLWHEIVKMAAFEQNGDARVQ